MIVIQRAIKRACAMRDINQGQLADLVPCSRSTMSQYCTGNRTPSMEMIVCMCVRLEMKLSEFF